MAPSVAPQRAPLLRFLATGRSHRSQAYPSPSMCVCGGLIVGGGAAQVAFSFVGTRSWLHTCTTLHFTPSYTVPVSTLVPAGCQRFTRPLWAAIHFLSYRIMHTHSSGKRWALMHSSRHEVSLPAYDLWRSSPVRRDWRSVTTSHSSTNGRRFVMSDCGRT